MTTLACAATCLLLTLVWLASAHVRAFALPTLHQAKPNVSAEDWKRRTKRATWAWQARASATAAGRAGVADHANRKEPADIADHHGIASHHGARPPSPTLTDTLPNLIASVQSNESPERIGISSLPYHGLGQDHEYVAPPPFVNSDVIANCALW